MIGRQEHVVGLDKLDVQVVAGDSGGPSRTGDELLLPRPLLVNILYMRRSVR